MLFEFCTFFSLQSPNSNWTRKIGTSMFFPDYSGFTRPFHAFLGSKIKPRLVLINCSNWPGRIWSRLEEFRPWIWTLQLPEFPGLQLASFGDISFFTAPFDVIPLLDSSSVFSWHFLLWVPAKILPESGVTSSGQKLCKNRATAGVSWATTRFCSCFLPLYSAVFCASTFALIFGILRINFVFWVSQDSSSNWPKIPKNRSSAKP